MIFNWPAIVMRLLPWALGALILWFAYDKVYDRGFNACQAAQAKLANKANDSNDKAAGVAGAKLNEEVGQKLPAIERNAYESGDRIRTVYLDRPVPGECAWSGGVLNELEAGREAANRAVRSGAGGAGAADTDKPR